MAETAFDRIISALEQRGSAIKPKPGAQQLVSAQCPAHEDRAPSLSVTGIEGQVLMHCHAGCAVDDVLASLSLTKADLFDTRRGADYRYDNGRVVHRKLDKQFPQSGTGAPPELYRLAKVRAAVAAGAPVFVAEGEKDVHALEAAGVVATCAPMGAGKWGKVDPSPLYGAKVLVIADSDGPGHAHAGDVAESLRGRAEVGVFVAKVGKDAADHLAAGHGVDEFVPLAGVQSRTPAEAEPSPAGDSPSEGRKSAATVLVELAQARYVFGSSTDGEPFATPLVGEPVTKLLRGGRQGLRAELARLYFREHGKAAPQQALADALLVLEGMAGEADPEPLGQRVAVADDGWWVDLGDSTGDAVHVTAAGWEITRPPVKFRRTVLTGELPRPATDGDLDALWALLNVAETDRPLVLAWLVSALIADVPHPILSLTGEQGTGKSTAAKILVSLVDPSPVPLRKAPRDADSWITAAAGSWVVAVDNVSVIPDWLSDTLCRAVTGDGDVRRQLYTDADLALFAFRRCILLNGIDLGAVRGDLADRLLAVDLDVINERARRLDADVTTTWDTSRPLVVGALLDLAASVASVLPSVRLETSPRMADFARILAAVDEVLGTSGLKRYLDRARTLATDALSADPFVVALRRVLAGEFVGTSAELMALVARPEDVPAREWPGTARKLTTLLKRQAPVMRRAGWSVRELPAGHDNALRWAVARPEIAREPDSQRSQHSRPEHVASVASLASVEYGGSQDEDEPESAPRCPTCGVDSVLSRTGQPALCLPCTMEELRSRRSAAAQ